MIFDSSSLAIHDGTRWERRKLVLTQSAAVWVASQAESDPLEGAPGGDLWGDGVLSHESTQDTTFTTFLFDFQVRGHLSTAGQANLWSTEQAHGIALTMA